ncbi:MAG: hypothetical protein OQK75_05920 [Gammaproteobacteria bacterium]|nr:hypothetical protein [Gammaproteobacteria bacterium]MCW8987192.1 hypothetical protein [Gammaproteobacteria bacterium]MCW9031647.1 hypothetical protein [Gammaproteobacteria bacterium]
MHKELLSALAITITFIAFIPYITSILQNKTQPHAFSWIIWASVTFIVFLAQLADGGGAGAWPIGVSGVITLFVAVLAYIKKSDHMIAKKDWLFFIMALTAIPFWYATSNPLWAVLILTTVDLLGFVPTFRKAYHYPYEEQLTFYILIASRNIIALMALEHYSLTTMLFPTATAIACLLFIQMVAIRRS